ncbi:MAG: type III-B CRISPR module-associated protein Cmr5 [Nitrospiraceae bacterium]|nr:type III-B CRISPR module-associated protein Cmr5 [Nitrospiraceae bacterium]
MTIRTNSQKMAQAAYQRILQRCPSREFVSFARMFPSFIHSCGLAQTIAFARSKGEHQEQYLEDIAAVLNAAGCIDGISPESLDNAARDYPVPAYIRLSRNTFQAAGWLKRYAEVKEPPKESE